MNIFYLSHDVTECAEQHVDKHAVKMVLEYAQLLSTAHRFLDGSKYIGRSPSGRKQVRFILDDDREHLMYSATHINHPSGIWVRKSNNNYLWLAELLSELCAEYTYRYGKVHKCERDGLMHMLLDRVPDNIPQGPFSEPTPAMPDEFKVNGSSIESYRKYYIGAKARMFNWKNRNTPEWIQNANI